MRAACRVSVDSMDFNVPDLTHGGLGGKNYALPRLLLIKKRRKRSSPLSPLANAKSGKESKTLYPPSTNASQTPSKPSLASPPLNGTSKPRINGEAIEKGKKKKS
jgi:hypothetical protein